MAPPNDSPAPPWSVKGVSREARDAARRAAAAEGATIGEWLGRAIRRAGEAPCGAAAAAEEGARAAEKAAGAAGGAEIRRAAAARIAASEARVRDIVDPLREVVRRLAGRVEALEREKPDGGGAKSL